MQVSNHNGTFVKPEQFDADKMETHLKKKTTKHVEVFEATPEELERREIMAKNGLRLGVKKRYQKTPKI